MPDPSNFPIPEKEYLTIEQRKIVNWHRMVLQTRNLPLCLIDLSTVLNCLKRYKQLNISDYDGYFSQHADELLVLANQLKIVDVNEPILQLYGYTDKLEFLSMKPESHISDYPDLVKLLVISILEGRQFIEVEACAHLRGGESVKVSIKLNVPHDVKNPGKIIISFTRLSDSGQLAIKRFPDKNVYTAFVDNAPVCIHEIDQEGRLQSMNQTGLNMMGLRDVSHIKGKHYLNFVKEADRPRIGSLMQRAFDGYSSEFEFTLITDTGTRIFTSCFIPMEVKAGETRGIVGVTQDITEAKASEEELFRMANYDPLTKLRNRSSFMDSSRQLWAQASRHQYHLALLFIDLDNFKAINDTFGHDAGDEVLQQISSRLADNLREEDLLCRYGGDEFVVLLSYIDEPNYAAEVASKLLNSLNDAILILETQRSMHASIGISFFPQNGESIEALIANADDAMYTAKRSGGNQYHIFKG